MQNGKYEVKCECLMTLRDDVALYLQSKADYSSELRNTH